MQIILAGHNIDHDIIDEFQKQNPGRRDVTPETIAAAYARISRNPAPVNELRVSARQEVEKARLSNKNIVFEMGHSSIAEHAVFNIDVIGVSRLLVEEIEHARLASYTEKSQRYVLLADDFVTPDEILGSGLEQPFVAMVRRQNAFYHALYAKLRPYVFETNRELAADPANVSLLEGWAKEDARYCLSLATEAQLGMTLNARSAELMLRRLAASPLAEARRFSGMLYEKVRAVAPSLVRYTSPASYDLERAGAAPTGLAALFDAISGGGKGGDDDASAHDDAEEPLRGDVADDAGADGLVRLLWADPGADARIAAVFLADSLGLPYHTGAAAVERMSENEKRDVFRRVLRNMGVHDAAPREFEHASMTLELVVSASCFAQLKRHRMATISAQRYDPALGATIPPAVREVGMDAAFREICRASEETASKIAASAPAAAPYILTNAHRRRVVMTINARELYHIARVRADRHAQWDIRRTAARITEIGREAMPFASLLACGKDAFAEIYAGAFDK